MLFIRTEPAVSVRFSNVTLSRACSVMRYVRHMVSNEQRASDTCALRTVPLEDSDPPEFCYGIRGLTADLFDTDQNIPTRTDEDSVTYLFSVKGTFEKRLISTIFSRKRLPNRSLFEYHLY